MATKELHPTMQAEINKLPEDQKVVLEAFFASSLIRTAIDVRAKRGKEGLADVLADEEFIALWTPREIDLGYSKEHRKYFEKSRKEHAEYIAYGAPFAKMPEATTFAASEPFTQYVAYTREASETGPAFLRILDAIPYTDMEGLKFIVKNSGVISAFDQQYFAPFLRKDLPERDVKEASKKAKEIAEILLTDVLFVFRSDPKWRSFVRDNFDKLFLHTSMIWYPWVDIRNYDPVAQYEKLERLWKLVPPENMTTTLDLVIATRFIFSSKAPFSRVLIKIEEELNSGNLAFVEDATRIIGNKKRPLSQEQVYWLNQFWEGKISFVQLKETAEKLEILEQKILLLEDEKGNNDPHTKALVHALKAFSKSDIFTTFDESFIVEHGIYPTDAVAAFLKEKGQQGVQELTSLKGKTLRGDFDPNNLLQRDLEYMEFLILSGRRQNSYESFSRTVFIEEGEEVPILDERDYEEARAAAFEAARVYWMIREITDVKRKVMVIGNNRYGKLFVIDPLRKELELLNDLDLIDMIGSKYVRSHTGKDMKRGSQIFSDNNLRRIASENPDIIVVDGTADNKREVDGRIIPRFSSAMKGFQAWVKDFNEGEFGFKPKKTYAITFKSFIESDKVVIDEAVVNQSASSRTDPHVTIINATIDPSDFPQFPDDLIDHKPAYFDDPEDNVSDRKKLVFTKNGLEEKDMSDYVKYTHAVQKLIEDALLEMIMLKSTQRNS